MNNMQALNITFSFRTYFTEGKLVKLIYYNEKTMSSYSIIIQIIEGYIKVIYNEKVLLQLNDVVINDGLWHDLYFLIDYSHSYYLLRLDHVFSDKIVLSRKIDSNDFIQFVIGTSFHGCWGNLSLNNQLISLQQQNKTNSIEFVGTKNGCQLPEIITDNLCSLYNPCYHGGECINNEEISFTCNCSKTRFAGRQCQVDLYPCVGHPCQFDEQCISSSSNSNTSFTCIPLIISPRKYLYIGFILIMSVCVSLVLFICYCRREKENFRKDKPFVSAPLIIDESSSIPNSKDGTMQTLLKSDYNRKETKVKNF